MAQHFQTAGTLCVEFEEKSIDVYALENGFGNLVIAAFSEPFTLEVTPADMQRCSHVGGAVSERLIE